SVVGCAFRSAGPKSAADSSTVDDGPGVGAGRDGSIFASDGATIAVGSADSSGRDTIAVGRLGSSPAGFSAPSGGKVVRSRIATGGMVARCCSGGNSGS